MQRKTKPKKTKAFKKIKAKRESAAAKRKKKGAPENKSLKTQAPEEKELHGGTVGHTSGAPASVSLEREEGYENHPGYLPDCPKTEDPNQLPLPGIDTGDYTK